MVQLLHGVTYVSLLTFVIAVAVRFVRISRLPLHLRWELYPVAHEGKRLAHGGSILEEPDWWTRPRETSRINELKFMLLEILFLKGLWEHNRSLWRLSFPFHFGLYLLVGTGVLLFLGALGELVGGLLVAPGTFLGGSLYFLTAVLGVLGAVLTILGGLGLLVRRLTDEDLKDYTSPSHIFNLLFIIAAAGSLLAAVILVDHDFSLARGYVASLMGGHKAPPLPTGGHGGPPLLGEAEALASPVMALEILLISLLIAYIPLTHMSHFFTKWFTWHKIRWDDEPNRVGSWIEKRIQEALNYPVSWSAEHIHADGKKTWADLATEEVQ